MFTGIVQDIGRVAGIERQGDWILTVAPTQMGLTDVALGASIACNGICLTVIDKNPQDFYVQMSQETLDTTTARRWAIGQSVNLERALRVGDELGGHYVSGHVDGMASLVDKQPDGDSLRLTFELPHEFTRFVVSKGSITLDGVSLTVNDVSGSRFGVNLIPHTLHMTTLGALPAFGAVNFEIDMIARYIDRAMVLRFAP